MVARLTLAQKVTGSNPVGIAKIYRYETADKETNGKCRNAP